MKPPTDFNGGALKEIVDALGSRVIASNAAMARSMPRGGQSALGDANRRVGRPGW